MSNSRCSTRSQRLRRGAHWLESIGCRSQEHAQRIARLGLGQTLDLPRPPFLNHRIVASGVRNNHYRGCLPAFRLCRTLVIRG